MRITRRFEFDAGHRILGHESKCANLHGHRYRAEITATAPHLDLLGRVVDFSVLKSLVGKWIDDNWDHNLLLNIKDPLIVEAAKQKNEPPTRYLKRIVGRDPFVMPNSENPTAENMASMLLTIAQIPLVVHQIRVEHVRLYETPNNWVDVTR